MGSVTGTRRRLGALVVASTAIVSACWGGGDDEPETADVPVVEPVLTVAGASGFGDATPVARLGVRLSDGTAPADDPDPIAVADGRPLTVEEVAAVHDRLPPWTLPEDPTSPTFAFPPETLLPPTSATAIDGEFPPADDAPVGRQTVGRLGVLRHQPDGDVDVAPFLTVTFDQPMVPLAGLADLDAADVPVRVTPELTGGSWRWVGTRTLRYDPDPGDLDRLPAATEYSVEIPAGTTSATGGRLERTFRWSFATPPPTVVDLTGDEATTTTTPVFLATFDQRVDPDDVLATVAMTVDGAPRAVRLATPTEIEDDERARNAVGTAPDGHTVAFRPVLPLPADSAFRITVGPGTPSAEGPLVSAEAAQLSGRTFGRLGIVRTSCDDGEGCAPGTSFGIRFTNDLDPDAFSLDQLRVTPEIPAMHVDVSGSTVRIDGVTDGATTYEVTFADDVVDVFGQSLGTDTIVEFAVGSAPPALIGFDRPWVTVDPSAERASVTVRTINHDEVRVRAWAVSPPDLDEYRAYVDGIWSDDDVEVPESWSRVFDETVTIDDLPDRWVETDVDLDGAFNLGGSQLVVRIDPVGPLASDDESRNRPSVAWVQRTTLGLDAFLDGEHLQIWTTDLRTGEPAAKIPIELIGDGRIATTDAEGVAEIDLGESPVAGLWANAGDRHAFLVADWYDGWQRQERADEDRWYVFDDRGVYRPGERVRLTGWVRNLAWSVDGQLALWEGAVGVRYAVLDAQGVELATGTADLDPLGGFQIAVDLPTGANLGPASVDLELVGVPSTARSTHSFRIEEFRRPRFEVSTGVQTDGPYVVDRPATVAVEATYFAGGPLSDADVEWAVTTQPTRYSPPGWSAYVFGEDRPIWLETDGDGAADAAEVDVCDDCGPTFDDTVVERFAGRTDDGGTHLLQIDFDAARVDLPSTVTAEATVADVDRQAWSARTDLLVHPAERYVGLRTERPFVELGTPIEVAAVVTDVDGATVAGDEVLIEAGRVETSTSGGRTVERLAGTQTCTLVGAIDPEALRCSFDTEVGGRYRITAIVTDPAGNTSRTELTHWVTGARTAVTGPVGGVDQQTVVVVPDRDEYAPGDVAELFVQSPFADAHGVLTVVRGGIVDHEPFVASDGSAVVELPIDEDWIPGITVQVDVVGEDSAFATGRVDLSVPPTSRSLTVSATPASAEVQPGSETAVTVAVSGADGEPVAGADVALVVVDEAVLAVTGYDLADPLDVFYAPVSGSLTTRYGRQDVALRRGPVAVGGTAGDDAATEESESTDEDSGDAGGAGAEIAVRADFSALAVYAPDETTGADGTVTVAVPIPDSVTRYRVMAVAVDGAERFGKGESAIAARLPLMVRSSPPRFLNFGDRVEFPVVVQNLTAEALDVDVVLETENLEVAGPTGRRVQVPAGDRVEVRIPATTAEVGTAHFRIAAVAGEFDDAVTGSIPVYTPATEEAFATYGTVVAGVPTGDDPEAGPPAIVQPLVPPTDAIQGFGGLEIGSSSTALQTLTDAVVYLYEHPYDSADTIASRIIAIAALRDVLDGFDASGLPPSSEIDARLEDDVDRLQALQNDDGGWPWIRPGDDSEPMPSVQAAHALVIAGRAGYDTDPDVLGAALGYLAEIDRHIPAAYDRTTRWALEADALYVRNEAGDRDVRAAEALYAAGGEELPLDALAWLWPSVDDGEMRDRIEAAIGNAAVETSGSAVFATEVVTDELGGLVARSDRRTDGVVLDALITQSPDSDLIPKVVAGLIGNQIRGRWNNTYENTAILLALRRYADAYESDTPDFVARAWLGDRYAAEATFRGRTTDQVTTRVPLDVLVAQADSDAGADVVLAAEGTGRLYYRLGLEYAPSDLVVAERNAGFAVERTYEAVDDPTAVRRDEDGTWRIRAGATVRVRVTMVADAQRTGVALVDPLPAGLEALNPALAVSGTPPAATTPDDARWWADTWYDHQNLRDDRAEAFAADLPGGVYEYVYVARATTPGEYVVPPARAEEMYAPEVFGRSSSARVVVG